MRLPTGKDTTPVHLYNPLLEDFTVQQADDDNIVHQYTAKAQDITTLPKYIADHLAKHLAQYIVLKREVKTNYEADYAAVLKEIYI